MSNHQLDPLVPYLPLLRFRLRFRFPSGASSALPTIFAFVKRK